jgi:hypothetical protein
MDQAMDIDSINRKSPWFNLAEAIAVHREATYQLLGTRVDNLYKEPRTPVFGP